MQFVRDTRALGLADRLELRGESAQLFARLHELLLRAVSHCDVALDAEVAGDPSVCVVGTHVVALDPDRGAIGAPLIGLDVDLPLVEQTAPSPFAERNVVRVK